MKLIRFWHLVRRKATKTPVRLWFLLCIASTLLLILCFGALGIIGYYIDLLPSLYDIGFEIFPILDARFLFEIGLITSLIFFVIAARKDWYQIHVLFFMTGIWFIMRLVMTSITILYPPPEVFGPISKDLNPQTLLDIFLAGLSARRVLFFSGHTGLPFLEFLLFRDRERPDTFTIDVKTLFWPLGFMALYSLIISETANMRWGITLTVIALVLIIFRKKRVGLRYICLIWSFVMALTVIVTRGHWSVDVVGAYLITGGIFYLFRRVIWPFNKIFDRWYALGKQIKTDLETED